MQNVELGSGDFGMYRTHIFNLADSLHTTIPTAAATAPPNNTSSKFFFLLLVFYSTNAPLAPLCLRPSLHQRPLASSLCPPVSVSSDILFIYISSLTIFLFLF
jgi:hypothetical protein